MITGLRLDNFRGFVTTQDLEFGKINLFYGPNSGGKSTILRALSLLKQSFGHNQVDHQCVLLPYSRDGVDLGSSTSLHHNLDISVPFSISLRSEGRELFRLARPARHVFEPVAQSPTDTPAASVSPSTENQIATEMRSHFEKALRQTPRPMFFDDLRKASDKVFLEDALMDWTLRVTIADDGADSSPQLQKVCFGNRHFLIHASRGVPSSSQSRTIFDDWLRNSLLQTADGDNLEVLNATLDTAIRRRLTRRQVLALRSRSGAADDEPDSLGYFALERIDLSDDYEKSLAAYFSDACDDIASFAAAVARDLEKLKPGEQQVSVVDSSSGEPFRQKLQDYFNTASMFFAANPDGAACVTWWKDDLKRSRLALIGYSYAEYDRDDIPPLAYWMTSPWWTAWLKTGVRPTGGTNKAWVIDGAAQCDEIADPVSLYTSTVEVAAGSLATVRDIGPERSSPERVYRVEARRQTAKDYVGRQATEIPRILHDSPQLLEELNSWLARVEIPYNLIVDRLEIRDGGGDLRQTGLFELNAELSHTRNARINLCDVGHGVFKQLALPVQVFLGRKLIITIEEPETNVHPRLQAEIADLIIEGAIARGHQFFAEAHSEILSLRLQRRIAEGRISHKDVRIFYVHAPAHGPCEVLPLALDQHGTLLNEPPGGFFDEWLREV
jgi:predicted ATPase